MRNKKNAIVWILAAIIVSAVFLWGPELLTDYADSKMLGQVNEQEMQEAGEGYRYTMDSKERLYLLAKCLNSQSKPMSEEMAGQNRLNSGYEEMGGSYALVVNKQGTVESAITKENVFEVCNKELLALYEKGVLPSPVKELEEASYDAVLYSAIDVLEPRNNFAVWKISLSTNIKNADKSGRLLDAYIDADSGKIYEFYVRTDKVWEEMEPGEMMQLWADYMGLAEPEVYDLVNPLLENTPYYAKYRFRTENDLDTVVTIGFYEGINELYLKICK